MTTRLFPTIQQAQEQLGPENDREHVRVGYPAIYEMYRFDWNTHHDEGVFNFLYHGGSSFPWSNE